MSLLEKEKSHAKYFYILYFVLFFTAIFKDFFLGFSFGSQIVSLIHMVFGLAFSALLISYSYIHFKRTLGQRKVSLVITGFFLLGLLLASAVTGLIILINGLTESGLITSNKHKYISYIGTFFIGVHMIFHLKHALAKKAKELLYTLDKTHLKVLLVLPILFLLIMVIDFYMPTSQQEVSPKVENYTLPYGEHPFRPSQTETSTGGFLTDNQIAGSNKCASCHFDIAMQWKSSMHKQAASDPTYVRNIHLLESKKGIEATRYCEGCHAPVALLTGELSQGGKHGGIKDTLAFDEGVSCLSCHNIELETHVKGVASYKITPHQKYLFQDANNILLRSVHNLLVNTNPTQHKTDMAKDFLKSPKLCATCHAQFMDKDMNGWGWVKMQDEYSAWLDSPYSHQHNHSFSHQDKRTCQDCHMPLVKANDPSADENGFVRSHNFSAANTAIPFLYNDVEQLEQTENFLKSGKIRMTIEPPYKDDAVQSGQQIQENIRNNVERPAYVYLNEEVSLKLVLTNLGVGHNFPGGTIDINESWIHFLVSDASGRVVYESGHIEEDHHVEKNAYFYRSLPVDKKGNLVWKHDLFNRIGESFKKVIPSGDSDIVYYTFAVPSWAKSPLTINSTLKYRKFNARYAKWALQDLYRELPVTDVARSTLSIPVKIKPAVKTTSSTYK